VPVVVGTILDPPAIRLGEFLRAVRERGPQLHPELRHGISGSVLREVQDGRVDLGFFLGEDGPAGGCRPWPRCATWWWRRGAGSRLEGRRWEDLAALPWIDTPRESVHHALLRPVFGGTARAPWPGWTRRPRCWTWCGPASA
jgi:DNA-binding transcriptional LysR family regulator